MDDYGVSEKDKKRYEFYSPVMFKKKFIKGGCDLDTFLIVDEAHYFKKNLNPIQAFGKIDKENTQAAVAIKCAMDSGKVLLLTATAHPNAPVDVVNLVAMVRGESELTEREFNKILANDQAFEEYFKCVFSFYENPKSKDFPEQRNHDVHLVMDENYYKQYKKIEDKVVSVKGAVTKSGEIKTAFYNNIRQATNSIEPNPKIKEAIKLIKEGKKTIVYSEFQEMGIKKIKDALDTAKIKYVEVHGKVAMKKRQDMVKAFNDSKSGVNVMIITEAGGVGLDLKGTRKIIHLEKGWNPAMEEQINGRGVRYKSHTHLPESERFVDVYYLILKKPSIAVMKKALGKKADQEKPSADEILDKIIKDKAVESAKFRKRLEKVSIDRIPGGCTKPLKSKYEILRPLLVGGVTKKAGKGSIIVPLLD